MEVNVHQAKTQLSELLRRVAEGEEIVIARAGTPLARLVPVQAAPKRLLGLDQALFDVPAVFDDTMVAPEFQAMTLELLVFSDPETDAPVVEQVIEPVIEPEIPA